MTKTAYFDCFAGAAGDMVVGALLNAGLELEALRAALGTMDLAGYAISAEKVRRGGMAGTKFHVEVAEGHHHRGLSDVEAIIDSGDLPGRAAVKAKAVFRRLAEAEAKVHGVAVEEVHFHEVGAVDSIVDIVSAAVGMEVMGIGEVVCSPIPTGSGWVEAAHGRLPVPAPATAELLVGAAIAEPIAEGPTGELTTPTGAAILTTLASGFEPIPSMALEAVGCGAGTREEGPVPNLLRVLIGRREEEGEADTVVELSANLDDCTGEVIAAAAAKLLEAGALDAWASPIMMKKGRCGWMVSALCLPADAGRIEGVLLTETTTFGVRKRLCRRGKLTRRHETVETAYGPVRIKVGARGGRDVTASPEFEDARAAAEAHGAAVRDVLAAAVTAWRAGGR